jgi:hypothetical protein
MIQLIVDYLWHDTHACFEITEGLIKLLGANQTRDGWNTWVTHLIRKIIKDSRIASFHKHDPIRVGYWSLLVEDILQIPCITRDLNGVQHRNVDVHSPDYFHEATDFFIFHRFLCLTGERSRCVSVMSLGEALPGFLLPFQDSVLPQPCPWLSLPL